MNGKSLRGDLDLNGQSMRRNGEREREREREREIQSDVIIQ